MIEVKHLMKSFENGGTPLKDVNAVIEDGDIIAVLGPSGTGKSTFLRCLNMLDPPTRGQIFLNGEEITAPKYPLEQVRKKVGMVFQSFNLFENLSVIENLMLPQIRLLGKSRQEAYDRGMELLSSVGMAEKSLSLPKALSGGQKQRVAIARTLCMDPELVLFDEPTSALDPTMVDEVKAVIRQVAASGVTMLIVTHDMKLAREISTKVFYMDEGILYESGSPEEIFSHPKKERTRRFIGRLKILEQQIRSRDFDYYGLISSLNTFGARNMIAPKQILAAQSVTEELVMNMILPGLSSPSIRLVYEHGESPVSFSMEITYGGPEGDPLSLSAPENELPKMIIRSKVKSYHYEYREEAGEAANTIRILLN